MIIANDEQKAKQVRGAIAWAFLFGVAIGGLIASAIIFIYALHNNIKV